MPAPIISLNGLSKSYGNAVAVDAVNLAIEQGTVTALVGPNGAGKTTLMRMVAGLLEPSSGSAVVDGVDMRDDPRGVHMRLGFLPDFFGLYDELTANAYLDYFARAYRLFPDSIPGRIDSVLFQVGLGGKGPNPIPTLSRGMRQRLAIARTLIHDPPILLLDEPASGLDPESRGELQSLFRKLSRSGKTLIVSSHILTELEDYCDHIAILRNGRLTVSGKVEEVRQSLGRHRRFRLRTAAPSETAQNLLRASGGVLELTPSGGEIHFRFDGGDHEAAALLKTLVDSGVGIVEFSEIRRGIEDAYLASLEGGGA